MQIVLPLYIAGFYIYLVVIEVKSVTGQFSNGLNHSVEASHDFKPGNHSLKVWSRYMYKSLISAFHLDPLST